MTEFLNQTGSAWWYYFAQAAWQATLLALLILIVVRLRPRWPARLHWGLLMIAVLKFALPPLVPVPGDILDRLLPGLERPEQPSQAAPRAGLTRASESAGTGPARARPGQESASAIVAHLDWRAWLMMLHLAGAGLLLGLIAAHQKRLMRIRGAARLVGEEELESPLADLIRGDGVRRGPELRVSENAGPLAMGIFRPAIVIPRALLERLPGRELRIVLAHELAHMRRGDLWTQVLTIALLAMWWFHPLYWVLLFKVRRVREDCCDDDVIARGFATPDEYCAALLHTSVALGSNRFNHGREPRFCREPSPDRRKIAPDHGRGHPPPRSNFNALAYCYRRDCSARSSRNQAGGRQGARQRRNPANIGICRRHRTGTICSCGASFQRPDQQGLGCMQAWTHAGRQRNSGAERVAG